MLSKGLSALNIEEVLGSVQTESLHITDYRIYMKYKCLNTKLKNYSKYVAHGISKFESESTRIENKQ